MVGTEPSIGPGCDPGGTAARLLSHVSSTGYWSASAKPASCRGQADTPVPHSLPTLLPRQGAEHRSARILAHEPGKRSAPVVSAL